jgi:hypothetical protein
MQQAGQLSAQLVEHLQFRMAHEGSGRRMVRQKTKSFKMRFHA